MLISSLSRVYFCSGEVYSDFLFLMWAFPLSKACFQIADMLLKKKKKATCVFDAECCTAPTLIGFLLFCAAESPGQRQHFCVFRKLFNFSTFFFFFLSSLESKDLFCLFHSCVVITPHWNIHSTLRLCTEPSPTWTAFPHSYQQLLCGSVCISHCQFGFS